MGTPGTVASQFTTVNQHYSNPLSIYHPGHQKYSASNGGVSTVVQNIDLLAKPFEELDPGKANEAVQVMKANLEHDIDIPTDRNAYGIRLETGDYQLRYEDNKFVNI